MDNVQILTLKPPKPATSITDELLFARKSGSSNARGAISGAGSAVDSV
jgi:hypothetical protein